MTLPSKGSRQHRLAPLLRMCARGLTSLVASISACVGDAPGVGVRTTEGATAADGGLVAAAPLEVEWRPCHLRTAKREPAECADVSVPLRWSDPNGTRLMLSVMRYRPPGVTTHGQLWSLQGGPGASAADFDGFGPYFANLGVDLDFYLVDQRGTGRSARLGCPLQESSTSAGSFAITSDEWPSCLADVAARWPNDGLGGFTVTNAATDLGELIAATRRPDDPVFVYGISYATYLVNRYLQLYPSQPTGVIFDSICGPDVCRSSQQDVRFNEVARLFFEACGADAFCSTRLGRDPWSRFGAMLDRLDAGACPAAAAAGLDRAAVRRAFAQLLYDWERRALIPAMVRRLERCEAKDVPVISRFGKLFHAPPSAASLEEFSSVLANHVALSELWDEPSPDPAVHDERERGLYVSNGLGTKLARLHDAWPRTPHDERWGRWANTGAAVLMMNGSLDPATPLSTQGGAKGAFAGPRQTFVELPGASHGALLNSPVPGGIPCGTSLVASFLKSGGESLDTECVAKLAPLTFEHSKATADFFGTSDLWGD